MIIFAHRIEAGGPIRRFVRSSAVIRVPSTLLEAFSEQDHTMMAGARTSRPRARVLNFSLRGGPLIARGLDRVLRQATVIPIEGASDSPRRHKGPDAQEYQNQCDHCGPAAHDCNDPRIVFARKIVVVGRLGRDLQGLDTRTHEDQSIAGIGLRRGGIRVKSNVPLADLVPANHLQAATSGTGGIVQTRAILDRKHFLLTTYAPFVPREAGRYLRLGWLLDHVAEGNERRAVSSAMRPAT